VRTLLVVANETLGGRALMEKVKEKATAAEDGLRVVVCVPRTNPRQGNIIYDEAVFDAAQVRIDLARKILREEGIADAIGEVGDPDPYTATMDAIAEHSPDEILISTYPAASSGWLRRDLIERIADATDVPVEHVVVDLDQEGVPFGVTLAVANRTLASPTFLEALKARATELERHVFIFVVPQEGGHGIAARQARARLTQVIDRARAAGLICAGMIADPDPFNAVMNAVQFFRVDDIVISTLPATRSGWLRADLIERVRRATNKPVEHVEATDTAEAAA
jgi:GNAT superfamily N-acetyltransferase